MGARRSESAELALECDAIEQAVLGHARDRNRAASGPGLVTRHHVLNCVVAPGADPDRAVCEVYVLEARAAGGTVGLEGRRELVDRERAEGAWRIVATTPVREWRTAVAATTP